GASEGKIFQKGVDSRVWVSMMRGLVAGDFVPTHGVTRQAQSRNHTSLGVDGTRSAAHNSASVYTKRVDRSLTNETGNLCGDSRRFVAKRNIANASDQIASELVGIFAST